MENGINVASASKKGSRSYPRLINLKQMLIESTKILEIDSEVIFFDYVANISSYYRYFDIVLFNSDWEGMPLAMWEAMASPPKEWMALTISCTGRVVAPIKSRLLKSSTSSFSLTTICSPKSISSFSPGSRLL